MPPRGKKRATADDDGSAAEAKKTKVTSTVKGAAAVDQNFVDAFGAGYHVYTDANGNPWDAMLNQTEIGKNANKFYKIQLLVSDAAPTQSLVWTRWGRVGMPNAQSMRLPGFKSGFDGHVPVEVSMGNFEKKFRDKSKNRFADVIAGKPFVKHDGKYELVEIDYGVDAGKAAAGAAAGAAAAAASPVKAAPVESELDKAVQDLVNLLFNKRLMEQTVIEMEFDVKKNPLGKLTEAQIHNGMEALKKIEELVMAGNPDRKELERLSNTYYTRIPHYFGMKRPPVIDSQPAIVREMDLVDALSDIKITMAMMDESTATMAMKPPTDQHYLSLDVRLNQISRDAGVFGMIHKYITNTHGSTHSHYTLDVRDVFDISKDLPWSGGKFKNRKLLWHGSRLTNWPGILKHGLKIAPPEAPVSGYMFGKGIYFADMATKSANYCHASPTQKAGLLVLCEVALGSQKKIFESDSSLPKGLPKTAHSVLGRGMRMPDPKQDVKWDGMTVPLGKEIIDKDVQKRSGYTLQYNEYIVYRTDYVRPRFLVWAQFNFKGGRRF